MNIDKNVRAYLIVFSRSPDDDLLVAATACFIVAGIILTAVSVCAILGVLWKKPGLIAIVSVIMFIFPKLFYPISNL